MCLKLSLVNQFRNPDKLAQYLLDVVQLNVKQLAVVDWTALDLWELNRTHGYGPPGCRLEAPANLDRFGIKYHMYAVMTINHVLPVCITTDGIGTDKLMEILPDLVRSTQFSLGNSQKLYFDYYRQHRAERFIMYCSHQLYKLATTIESPVLCSDSGDGQTSERVQSMLSDYGVGWLPFPTRDPRHSPIEMVFFPVKEYARQRVEERGLDQLEALLAEACATISPATCRSFFRKVGLVDLDEK